jgi:CHRD domain
MRRWIGRLPYHMGTRHRPERRVGGSGCVAAAGKRPGTALGRAGRESENIVVILYMSFAALAAVVLRLHRSISPDVDRHRTKGPSLAFTEGGRRAGGHARALRQAEPEEVVVSSTIRHSVVVALSAFTILSLAPPASGDEGGRPFTTTLLGANEVNAQGVPNQGDPDGMGTATLRINPGQGEVCWSITVTDVAPVFAAHIHVAPPTAPGPIVVPLNPFTGGCTSVDRGLAIAIIRNPDAYYVNVHNAQFPAGALRGQLSREP